MTASPDGSEGFGPARSVDGMGREIDRAARTSAALEVTKRHPGMVAFVLAPGLVTVGLVWWLTNGFLALLVALVLGGALAYKLLRG